MTVELLVELGKMYLPDAAKAQQAIDQWGVPQDAVPHMVDIERPEGLLHDQAHLDHIRTDLGGPGMLRVRGKQTDPSIFLLNKQLVRNCWNFRENIMKNFNV